MKITLSWSYSFIDKFKEIAESLEEQGIEILLPMDEDQDKYAEMVKKNDRKWLVEWKKRIMQNHFQKIKESDALLVCNYKRKWTSGYIGHSTLMEMGVACHHWKKIYLLNKVHSRTPSFDEVLGCSPILLQGDLSKITEQEE